MGGLGLAGLIYLAHIGLPIDGLAIGNARCKFINCTNYLSLTPHPISTPFTSERGSLETLAAMARRPRSDTPFALLAALLLLFSPALAGSDAPFVVAHKKVSLTRPKPGVERISVSIDLYNQGSATAYDVSLTDDSWAQDTFDIVSSTTSKTWERLDAGSVASHSFVLDSKVKGMFHGSPAVIKFRVPTKAALQEAFSTPILPLDILADRPPEKKFEWAKRLLAKYGSLVSVLSLIGLFIYVLVSPSKSNAAKASKKRR